MAYEGGSLKSMVKAVEHASKDAGRAMAENMGKAFKDNVQKNTPVETRKLRESYKVSAVTYKDMQWSGRMYTNVHYAAYVEYGTGLWGPKKAKFKITPKKPGGFLAFNPYVRTNANGKTEIVLDEHNHPVKGGKVYTTLVWHPGSPGHAMFRIGAAITEHEVGRWSSKTMRRWKTDAESRMAT